PPEHGRAVERPRAASGSGSRRRGKSRRTLVSRGAPADPPGHDHPPAAPAGHPAVPKSLATYPAVSSPPARRETTGDSPMRRNRPPTLVTMWMLDVFCCALGCVTLLWLLKTREAGIISDEAANATTLLTETRGKLDESEKLAALRLANAEKLAATIDELNNRLALMRQERDKDAKHLALVEEDLSKSKEDLAVAMTRADTLDKTIKGLT